MEIRNKKIGGGKSVACVTLTADEANEKANHVLAALKEVTDGPMQGLAVVKILEDWLNDTIGVTEPVMIVRGENPLQ
jgi:hypothetical protein